ncbi:YihY/virulence factor BrkB family protein [Tautonia sociabilis]|uniref:YihY/virulence factor BrkB family protein n=1 Tax=Tautonia sociabilis TaxID=2080755 RepID=UPI001F42C238|nr:YihY/virulence factor BrkB family protein [Tautonia sociabilis]
MAFPPIRLQSAFNLGGLTPIQLARRTWCRAKQHSLMSRAAAVAFYAMLALVPFLALMLTIAVKALPDISEATVGAGADLGNQAVVELERTLEQTFPREAVTLIKGQIERIQDEGRLDLLSFGLLVTIWLSSTLFLEIMDALNAVHGVSESRPFWRLRLQAIGLTLVQATVLIGALVSIVAWPQIIAAVGLGTGPAYLASGVRWLLIFLMLLISFAMTYYFAPDAETRWEWITPGSLLGTLVFIGATLGFRVYVQNFANYNQTYGALGGVMVLMFWFWISALVLLFSAQVNRVIEDASPVGKKTGQKVDPTSPPDYEAIPPELAPEPEDRERVRR